MEDSHPYPPLVGYTVGVTGDRRAEEQVEMLTRRGAQVVHGPVMRTSLLHDSDVTRDATERALDGPIDVLVLTTGIGTRSWFGVAESADRFDSLVSALRQHPARTGAATVIARGPKARSVALGHGIEVDWHAPGETSAEVVAHLAGLGVAGHRVVVQRDGGDPRLAQAVAALGAEVVDVPVYRWDPPEDASPARRVLDAACDGRLHALTFTCAYAVGSAFALAPRPDDLRAALQARVRAVAVGPVTADALRAHGVTEVVEPARARLGSMIKALESCLAGQAQNLVLDGHERVWQGDAVIDAQGGVEMLTPGESRVLGTLLDRAPGVVAKTDLVDGPDDHAAEVAVARLRAKLGPLAGSLRTVPRRGYQWLAPRPGSVASGR